MTDSDSPRAIRTSKGPAESELSEAEGTEPETQASGMNVDGERDRQSDAEPKAAPDVASPSPAEGGRGEGTPGRPFYIKTDFPDRQHPPYFFQIVANKDTEYKRSAEDGDFLNFVNGILGTLSSADRSAIDSALQEKKDILALHTGFSEELKKYAQSFIDGGSVRSLLRNA